MFRSQTYQAARVAARSASARSFATVSPVVQATRNHKIVIIGGGTSGLAVSHQLYRSGKFAQDDIAIVDPAEWHHYQAGWTLVGGGVKRKEDLRRPQKDLVGEQFKFYNEAVGAITPEDNHITLSNGDKVNYEHLIVASGIKINYDSIKGLPEALADRSAPVATIYGYETCDKVFRNVEALRKGTALFTQPAGVIKCAGAPQKVMWLALDHWKQTGQYNPANPSASPINIEFATGLPTMFGVPKYSATLEKLRQERGVKGHFQHDLIEVNGNEAIFSRADGEKITKKFDFLHAVPKMGPQPFVKSSAIANEAGYVDVDDSTLRHKTFSNVWACGDASSLPTSKTTAAITSQTPILARNLLSVVDGKEPTASYDGYTSCPLTTEYGKVLLAEFKYGGVPQETFGDWFGIDQATPRRAFYYMKRDFFPWVYYAAMVKGNWAGPKIFSR